MDIKAETTKSTAGYPTLKVAAVTVAALGSVALPSCQQQQQYQQVTGGAPPPPPPTVVHVK